MKKVTPILLVGLFSSGAVLAQDVNFDRQDKDSNGYLSQGEWRNVQGVSVQFEQADKDGDQRLSKTEVESATSKSGSQGQSQQMGSQQISSEQGSSQQGGSQQGSSQQGSSQMRTQQISSQQGSSQQQGGSQQGSSQQNRGPEMSEAAFTRIDANGDQRISQQEAQQSNDDYVSRTFDGTDENGNGYIEKNEIKADKQQ